MSGTFDVIADAGATAYRLESLPIARPAHAAAQAMVAGKRPAAGAGPSVDGGYF